MLESIIESSTNDLKFKSKTKNMNRSTSNPKIIKESKLSHTIRSAKNCLSKDYSKTSLNSAERIQDKHSPTLSSRYTSLNQRNDIKNKNSKIAKL